MRMMLYATLVFAATALSLAGAHAETQSDKDRLARTVTEEETLVFDSFDNDTALQLGLAMVKYAQEMKSPQTVFDIRRNGQILFRAALAGSSADNERWVDAKIATMERFHVSSERKKLDFRANMGADWLKAYPNGGGDPVRFWNLSPLEAAGLVGGGFPIFVKSVGYVGTIVASGGPDDTDHDFIVAVLKKFLSK